MPIAVVISDWLFWLVIGMMVGYLWKSLTSWISTQWLLSQVQEGGGDTDSTNSDSGES